MTLSTQRKGEKPLWCSDKLDTRLRSRSRSLYQIGTQPSFRFFYIVALAQV